MRAYSDLRPHQMDAVREAEHFPQQMLWHGMGSGKTASVLTTIVDRIDKLQVYGTLVVAPLRVCQLVWEEEAKRWAHTQHLSFSFIHGNPAQRQLAMRKTADIYLINYELVEWLVDELIHVYLGRGRYLPFNMLVADEISKWKDPSSNRHKAIRKILAWIPYRVGLTGTPASNGYGDLFGQYMVVDSGDRLGINMTAFRTDFFTSGGFGGYAYDLTTNGGDRIKQRISDITHQYAPDRQDDELPIINDIKVRMPPALQAKYNILEHEMFVELDSGAEVEVFNKAALSMKCRQFANGTCYVSPESDEWERVHDYKLQALDSIVEEAAGEPIIVVYQFRHDLERIMKRYKGAKHFGGTMSKAEALQTISDWQAGKIPMLLGHPASMGYGTDGLQYGGHIEAWFGLTWSLDDYEQTIARLDRTGQDRRVVVHRILTADTIDELISDRITGKAVTQDELRESINQYRQRRGV